ncbi:hypothetical protein JMJ35_010053 [Cladonia borealis]|uniref:Ubiquitin-like domain-containing protein n=1 Tax=Cladonia borealis TaxID=184061 RepID=A0AA39QT06_9LECA|nr:hypothetical protein JMJ35_010053 [Cladonia borealis]
MPIPSPLSAGDIIALITLLKQIRSGLKDHGGASDDYQNISQELKRNLTVFEDLKSIKLPDLYSRHRERIAGIADGLHKTNQEFQGNLSRYETRLGDNAPKGFHRGSIAKAKWVAYTSKKIPTYRASINAQLHALQSSFNELLVDIALAASKQGTATQALLETAIVNHSAYHKHNKYRLGEAHRLLASIEGQDRALYGLVEKQAVKSEQKQQKLEMVLMSNQETLATMREQSDHLVNLMNKGHITVNKNACDTRSLVRSPRIAPEQASDGHQAQSASELSKISEQLDLLLKSKHSLVPPPKPQAPTPYAQNRLHDAKELNLDNFTDVQCLALYILALKGLEYLQRALRLYPQLLILFWGLCQTIPASMSNLLSDNVIILDILDRKHSLQYEHFRHSAVFKAMLLAKFEDTPGFEKIREGQFSLCDPENPEVLIDFGNWDHFVRPRARFAMMIHYSAVKMSNKRCAKCDGSVVEFKPYSWMCPHCNISFRTPPRLQFEEGSQTDGALLLAYPIQHNKPHGEGLAVPAKAEGRGEKRHWLEAFRSSLSNAQIYETQSGGSSRVLDLKVPIEASSPRLSGQQPQEGELTEPAASDERLGSFLAKPMDELTDKSSLDHAAASSVRMKQSMRKMKQKSMRKMKQESMRKLEAAELQYFKRIRILEDSTIYDAALSGNYTAVAKSLGTTTHIDGVCGLLGTPLTAAVISDSSAVVRLLLEHGANPLLEKGPLGTPLRVSVLRGHDNILSDLLIAKYNGSTGPKFTHLTPMMSSGLFTATVHKRMSSAEVLLMHNADPFLNCGGQLSAFLNAVVRSLHEFVELFLRYAASRRLLLWSECEFALSALSRDPESLLHSTFLDPHFRKCCAELRQGRGKMMQQRIRSRMASIVGYDPTKWSTGWDGESTLLHFIKMRRSVGTIDESNKKDDVESGSSVSTHAKRLPTIRILDPSWFVGGSSGSTHSGSTHSGSTHSGSTHSGSTYSGSTYSGSTYSGSTYSGSTYSGPTHWYCGECRTYEARVVRFKY